jgi:hypothetical protein
MEFDHWHQDCAGPCRECNKAFFEWTFRVEDHLAIVTLTVTPCEQVKGEGGYRYTGQPVGYAHVFRWEEFETMSRYWQKCLQEQAAAQTEIDDKWRARDEAIQSEIAAERANPTPPPAGLHIDNLTVLLDCQQADDKDWERESFRAFLARRPDCPITVTFKQ